MDMLKKVLFFMLGSMVAFIIGTIVYIGLPQKSALAPVPTPIISATTSTKPFKEEVRNGIRKEAANRCRVVKTGRFIKCPW
jgi:hypothetical protein